MSLFKTLIIFFFSESQDQKSTEYADRVCDTLMHYLDLDQIINVGDHPNVREYLFRLMLKASALLMTDCLNDFEQ